MPATHFLRKLLLWMKHIFVAIKNFVIGEKDQVIKEATR